METATNISGYTYKDSELNASHGYLLPALLDTLAGVDASAQGIEQAPRRYPHLNLHSGSAYDSLVDLYGQYPVVVSLEVVEHVYAPKDFSCTMFDLVALSGKASISTPYHGYWENLALALTGRFDQHFTALWDHGHIKFWSMDTLSVCSRKPGSGISRSSAWGAYQL